MTQAEINTCDTPEIKAEQPEQVEFLSKTKESITCDDILKFIQEDLNESNAVNADKKYKDVIYSNRNISINKLFTKLPESKLKAVQVYFCCRSYIEKYGKKSLRVNPLKIVLIYKEPDENNKKFKILECDEINYLFPGIEWIITPQNAFKDIKNFKDIDKDLTYDWRLMKLYINAERTPFNSSFYHKCKVYDIEDQSKLKEFHEQWKQAQKEFEKMNETLFGKFKYICRKS